MPLPCCSPSPIPEGVHNQNLVRARVPLPQSTSSLLPRRFRRFAIIHPLRHLRPLKAGEPPYKNNSSTRFNFLRLQTTIMPAVTRTCRHRALPIPPFRVHQGVSSELTPTCLSLRISMNLPSRLYRARPPPPTRMVWFRHQLRTPRHPYLNQFQSLSLPLLK